MLDGYRVIDGDGHMQEPMDIWEKYTEPAFRERAPKVVGHVGKTLFKYAPGEAFPQGNMQPRPESVFEDCLERYGDAYLSWWSLETRMAHMDSEGVDIQVGFQTNGGAALSPSITDPKLQAALCRAYNNWATDFSHDSRGRVQHIGLISLLDVDEAIEEIRRISGRGEVAAINIPDSAAEQRQWSSAEFDPLWAALAEEGLAACFHGGSAQARIFQSLQGPLASVSHAIGFPLDAMVSMGIMMFGSAMERHPNLRCAFFESNAGWLPFWLSRMDDHAVGRQGRFMYGSSVPLKPSEYFRRQCSLACDADEGTLAFVVDYMDGDNLVFNTDYPHPDAPFPGSVSGILSRPLKEDHKRKILWDNSVKLYGERVLAAA